MRTVTVRMDAADLSGQMAAMREWLDRHWANALDSLKAHAKSSEEATE